MATTIRAPELADGIRDPGEIPRTCGCDESRRLRGVIAQLVGALERERAENRSLRQALYGRSFEKDAGASPPPGHDEKETKRRGSVGKKGAGDRPRKRGAQKGHTPHGRTVPDGVKAGEMVHAIPAEGRFCSDCGRPWIALPLEKES